jgi:hypothetical protein
MLMSISMADEFDLDGDDDDDVEDVDDIDDDLEEEIRLATLSGAARAKEIAGIYRNPTKEHLPQLFHILQSRKDHPNTISKAFHILMAMDEIKGLKDCKKLTRSTLIESRYMGALLLSKCSEAEASAHAIALLKKPMLHGDVQYACVYSLGMLRKKDSLPTLKRMSSTLPIAKLAMCLIGDIQHLPQVLTDFDDVVRRAASQSHEISIAHLYGWSKKRKDNEIRKLDKMRLHIKLFGVYASLLDEQAMTKVVPYLKANGESRLVDILYASMRGIVTPHNYKSYLALMVVPVPELQEETARSIAAAGETERTAVCQRLLEMHAKKDEIVLVRLMDILPKTDRGAVVSRLLKSQDDYVIEQLLLRAIKIDNLLSISQLNDIKSSGLWRDSGRIHSLLSVLHSR